MANKDNDETGDILSQAAAIVIGRQHPETADVYSPAFDTGSEDVRTVRANLFLKNNPRFFVFKDEPSGIDEDEKITGHIDPARAVLFLQLPNLDSTQQYPWEVFAIVAKQGDARDSDGENDYDMENFITHMPYDQILARAEKTGATIRTYGASLTIKVGKSADTRRIRFFTGTEEPLDMAVAEEIITENMAWLLNYLGWTEEAKCNVDVTVSKDRPKQARDPGPKAPKHKR